MANKKKKKNRKHINRRKREGKQTVQVETQESGVQRFLTKRSLVCGLIILTCIVCILLPESWCDHFIMKSLRFLSIGSIVLATAVLFYLNYTEKSVKILYWVVFIYELLSWFLIWARAWMLLEFIMLTILTLYTCIVYLRENRKGTKKFVKTSKHRKTTLNSFVPMAIVLVWRAMVLFFQFSRCTYLDQGAVFGLGTAIGLAIALALILWLCFSGYKYLERKGSDHHSTAGTAICILVASIIFGWFLVAIPNQSFVVQQTVLRCEIQNKYERHRKGTSHYEMSVRVKGEEYYIEVGSEKYDECNIGDLVEVELNKGLFGLEYLYIPND